MLQQADYSNTFKRHCREEAERLRRVHDQHQADFVREFGLMPWLEKYRGKAPLYNLIKLLNEIPENQHKLEEYLKHNTSKIKFTYYLPNPYQRT